jgi:regulator of sirC expression with transglutaminase-like and TPR domain
MHGPIEVLSKLAKLPDDQIPLIEGALSISLIERPEMDIEEQCRKFEDLVSGAKDYVSSATSLEEMISLLNGYFFLKLGFRGNSEDYYNPNNSLIDVVMERKLGIPITISVIYIEVAKRLGINIFGVGFPGHFLLGYTSTEGVKYLDPFDGGRRLTDMDMQRILDRLYHEKLQIKPSFLQPLSNRTILVRMLNNLKYIYLENGQIRKALLVLQCITLLVPDSAQEVRDMGILNYNLRNYEDAIEDLSRYLSLSPNSDDADQMRGIIKHIRSVIEALQ